MSDEPNGDGPVRYLSDDWLRRADELLADQPPLEAAVAVGMIVQGGPDGDRRYRMVLGPDRVGVDRSDEVGVSLTMDWDVAVAIAQGRSSAQRAFLDGRLQLGGDAGVLLGHQKALAAVEDRLGPLRAVTDYDEG
ncbi:MAG: SCP2 sterol-binding domain-containing protein [Actinomycetota bacterium]